MVLNAKRERRRLFWWPRLSRIFKWVANHTQANFTIILKKKERGKGKIQGKPFVSKITSFNSEHPPVQQIAVHDPEDRVRKAHAQQRERDLRLAVDLAKLEETLRDRSRVLPSSHQSSRSLFIPGTQDTHRHLRIVRIVVRRHANCGLDAALDVALVRIHLHQPRPRFCRVARRVEAALVRLLRLLLVLQAQPQVAQDFPLQRRLAVRHVLRLEMRNLGPEDGPYTEVLYIVSMNSTPKKITYLIQDHEEII
jgi:hypothetical protein